MKKKQAEVKPVAVKKKKKKAVEFTVQAQDSELIISIDWGKAIAMVGTNNQSVCDQLIKIAKPTMYNADWADFEISLDMYKITISKKPTKTFGIKLTLSKITRA